MKFPMTRRVDYHSHTGERTQGWESRRLRKIGFAPWNGFPSIDDPNQVDETFAQQEARNRPSDH
jgi:hypothetical protein